MSDITVYSPVGVNLVEARAVSARLAGLAGANVGIMNNSKTNSELLQDELVRLLGERFALGTVSKHIKPNASRGAEGIDAFAGEIQAAITALGD